MNTRRRLLLATAAFALFAVGLTAPVRSLELVERKASDSATLKYLPADYYIVAECNWGTLMQLLAMTGPSNPQYAQFQQAMQMVKNMIGIDPEREIQSAAIIGVGNPAAGKPVAVIRGSFDNDAVSQKLSAMAQDAEAETYKDQKLYSVPNAKAFFPEPSTIIVGDETALKSVIDQLATGAELPAELKSVLDRTPADSVVWTALKPKVVLEHAKGEWKAASAELIANASKLDCASVYFALPGDGLLVKALGYASGGDGAASLHKYLSDRKGSLLKTEGSNVVFASLLMVSNLETSGQFVEGSLRLTVPALAEVWATKVIVKP